jgi:hypothetical protein
VKKGLLFLFYFECCIKRPVHIFKSSQKLAVLGLNNEAACF